MKHLKTQQELNESSENLNISDVGSSFYDEEGWNALEEEDGEGIYCCGKRMVEIGNTFTCLKCGGWEYSSS